MDSPILFLVGPTAVGKTSVACRLAESIGGEVISADAMQVYREIRVASGRPDDQIMQAVPHHMTGVVSISREFDVARFRRDALRHIREVHRRGHLPLVVGGSGMYISILLDGIFPAGGRDEALRSRLMRDSERYGSPALHRRLRVVDPVAAGRIHPHDARRIIRALEVFALQKRPITELQPKRSGLWNRYPVRIFGLTMERSRLYARINQRVERMFRQGIVDEMRGLRHCRWGRTAKALIGVKEVLSYLEGACTLPQAKEAMKLNTRRLAKRQWTWFNKDKRIEWIELREGMGPAATARIIAGRLKRDPAWKRLF